MKKKLLTVAVLISFISISEAQTEIIRLAAPEWPPHTSEHLDNYGYHAEIVTEAMKLAGHEIVIEFYPWTRGLEMVKNGNIDGIMAITESRKRNEFIIFSDPVSYQKITLIRHRNGDSPREFQHLTDVKEYSIGYVRDYIYAPEFDATSLLKKEMCLSESESWKKLFYGRIDFLITTSSRHFFFEIEKNYPTYVDLVEEVSPPISLGETKIGFSRRRPDCQILTEDFNRGLALLKSSGRYDEILNSKSYP